MAWITGCRPRAADASNDGSIRRRQQLGGVLNLTFTAQSR